MSIDVIILLLGAVIAVPIFKRLGLGSVLGYLTAGTIVGPWGLGLIGDVDDWDVENVDFVDPDQV